MGLTDAVLVFSGKRLLLSISLLIMLVKSKSMMLAESLIILCGILSGPVAVFWIYAFNSFIHFFVAYGKSKVLTFRFVWFLMLTMLE